MSKQICFYSTEPDLKDLFSSGFMKDIILIENDGTEITIEEFLIDVNNYFSNDRFSVNTYYLSDKNSIIEYDKNDNNYYVNPTKSDVIEFYYNHKIPPKVLDTSSVDKLFTKNGFLIIDDSLKYQALIKELCEKPHYIDNPNYVKNGYEHGRFWYCNKYIDDTGNIVMKSNRMLKVFNQIRRYIAKNYLLSCTKFAYIGLDAYKNYQMNGFIPCSGKNAIKFPVKENTGDAQSDKSTNQSNHQSGDG